MSKRIAILPGDGIGPEIMAATREVLNAVGEFELDERPIGGASIDAHGEPLTAETLAACKRADAVLLGAVGGPKWDSTVPGAPRPERGLLELRQGLELYANVRPCARCASCTNPHRCGASGSKTSTCWSCAS